MRKTVKDYLGERPQAQTVKIREAAAILGICENSVRRLIDRGKIRTIRVLRHHLIPVAELDKLLAGD